MAIGACTEEAGKAGGIFVGGSAEVVDDFALGLLARNVEIAREAILLRDDFKERINGSSADGRKHLFPLSRTFG